MHCDLADGRRLQKSSGMLYWYGTGSDAVMGTDLSNNMRYNYFFFGGQRVGRSDISNSITWYFGDHLGSSRVVWSTAANDNSDFYPFGGERVISSGTANTYKFTAKERDPESGLDNFGARYNSSSLGRFASADNPKFSEKTNPQTWNLYSYVSNNPLSRVDVTGNNWFFLGGTWQWHPGSDVTDNGNPCKRGSKSCNHSDWTRLLVVQKLNDKTDHGATKVRITLYGQNKKNCRRHRLLRW
jgi:RHS repeat-associated protein